MGIDKGKLLLCIIAAGLVVALVFFVVYLKNVVDYKQAVKDIAIGGVCLADVSDGTYVGECDVKFISAKVEVVLRDGRIEDVVILEHKNERGAPAEVVVERIVAAQNVDVDAVTGATNSSTVLKKAVENALRKGL